MAAELLDRAQWADDEFVAEYLSGVLASARTEDGRDDSGVAWTSLVGRLSSDQLRLHFLLYSALRSKVIAEGLDQYSDWRHRVLIVTYVDVLDSMEWQWTPTSWTRAEHRLLRAAYGLSDERLIDRFYHGDQPYLARPEILDGRAVPWDGVGALVFRPTSRGMSLYLHAHGEGNRWPGQFADDKLALNNTAVGLDPPQLVWSEDLPKIAPADADARGLDG